MDPHLQLRLAEPGIVSMVPWKEKQAATGGTEPQSPDCRYRSEEGGRLCCSKAEVSVKKKKKQHSKQPTKNPKLRFVGETTSFLPISILVLMLGLLSTQRLLSMLSASRAVEGRALPPCAAHNGRSMGSLFAASCGAQGETERPHIPEANNCPQCTNRAALWHHTAACKAHQQVAASSTAAAGCHGAGPTCSVRVPQP